MSTGLQRAKEASKKKPLTAKNTKARLTTEGGPWHDCGGVVQTYS